MRHLISLALLVAAMAAYTAGWGPFFFGAPVLGGVLLAGGLMLEVLFWRRALRKRPLAVAASHR